MTGGHASSTEAALAGQRIGALQLRVAIFCAFAQAFDGYDISAIGMAAPSLSHAWNVPPAAFATAFVMSNVGVMVGALASGLKLKVQKDASSKEVAIVKDTMVLDWKRDHPILRERVGHRIPAGSDRRAR